ncbi:MAG: NHL repeat-containing protein [Candidatus Muiribacteriaceae bacterium]
MFLVVMMVCPVFSVEIVMIGSISHDFKYPISSVASGDSTFVLDMKEKYVYRFSADGKLEMKFGGDDHFMLPVDIETDGFSGIYVLDSHQNCVKKFDFNGIYMGISAQKLHHPSDISRDEQGRFHIADYGNKKIKVYDDRFQLTEIIHCTDENGNEFSPTAVACSSNRVYVSSWQNSRIYVYNMKGVYIESFGSDEISEKNSFYKVEGIAFDGSGRRYILDWGNSALKIFSEQHEFITEKGGYGEGDFRFKYPTDLKIRSNKMYITDALNSIVKIYSIRAKEPPSISIRKIDVPVFPVMDIYLEHNISSFDAGSVEVYINGKQLEIKERDSRNRRIRVDFPEELLEREVDFYGFYHYNKSLKVRFEKKIRLEKTSDEK